MRRILLSGLGLLAACGTPQEQCIARQTRDLRILDRLITETQGNLDRGFALEQVEVFQTRWVTCAPPPPPPFVEGVPPPPPPQPRLCLDDVVETETRAKAINLTEEAQKLASMKAKRKSLAKAAEPAIAACRNAYPE